MKRIQIDPDIRKAETLPSDFYTDPEVYSVSRNSVFARTWQWIGNGEILAGESSVYPTMLLPGCLDEPLVFTRDNSGSLHGLSNVCTHRGHLVAHHPGRARKLRCMYHGRQFGLDGQFLSMPEFEKAEDFPRACDNLAGIPVSEWHGNILASLNPAFDFKEIATALDERVGFLPIDQFRLDLSRSKDYLVHANWALYCDNYLEGFHIPFVHAGLNAVLDYSSYETILYRYANLQIGVADGATECFDLPEGHPDSGKRIAAYYYWIFPNLMLNFYPWGLSVNVVRPTGFDRCRVSFLSYVYREDLIGDSAGAELDKVEREDEAVVESVQLGLKSRYYNTGRFSPTREQGVHHFHRLLAEFHNAS